MEMASSGLCQVTVHRPCSEALPSVNSVQSPVYLCSESTVFHETETEQLGCDPGCAAPSWDASPKSPRAQLCEGTVLAFRS